MTERLQTALMILLCPFCASEMMWGPQVLLYGALGFNDVINALHVVNQSNTPIRFFDDQRQSRAKGLVIPDNLIQLGESRQYENLAQEAESAGA